LVEGIERLMEVVEGVGKKGVRKEDKEMEMENVQRMDKQTETEKREEDSEEEEESEEEEGKEDSGKEDGDQEMEEMEKVSGFHQVALRSGPNGLWPQGLKNILIAISPRTTSDPSWEASAW
jgi:hypothetical protein